MAGGYTGKILNVDLTTGEWREEHLPEEYYRRVLSGMGLAASQLYRRIPTGADPLGPENVLAFVSGLLTGSGSLFTGRWMVAAKSPLTGGWGDANCGGHLSPAIKRCGYDGIFFSGIAPAPVALTIIDGQVQLIDAADLWGQDTVATEDALKERLGARTQVACIGPGGERLSLMAGIATDHGRMAARSGLGAVMGSKRLKAIALAGKGEVPVADKEAVRRTSKVCLNWVKKPFPVPPGAATPWVGSLMAALPVQNAMDGLLYINMLKKWGTVSMNQASLLMGDSPVKNWAGTRADFDRHRSAQLNPDRITAREQKKYFCFSCPLGCGGICSGSGGYAHTHKPEYETCAALGTLLLNEDADSLFYLNELLNRAGLDTISTGSTVAFALECFEKGLLTAADCGGLELTWGNTEAIKQLIRMIIAREGIGDLLADGSARAARRLGGGSEQWAMHAGGQDLPMHDSRMDPGHGLLFSADATPGRHTSGCFLYYEMYQLWKTAPTAPRPSFLYSKGSKYSGDASHAAIAAACSKYTSLYNGAGLCMFGAFLGAARIRLFDWLNGATGWNLSPDEYLAIGARIQTLRQAFNVKQGLAPANIRAADRALGTPPQECGPNRGRSVPLDQLRSAYWREFGWDAATGAPQPETLADALGPEC